MATGIATFRLLRGRPNCAVLGSNGPGLATLCGITLRPVMLGSGVRRGYMATAALIVLFFIGITLAGWALIIAPERDQARGTDVNPTPTATGQARTKRPPATPTPAPEPTDKPVPSEEPTEAPLPYVVIKLPPSFKVPRSFECRPDATGIQLCLAPLAELEGSDLDPGALEQRSTQTVPAPTPMPTPDVTGSKPRPELAQKEPSETPARLDEQALGPMVTTVDRSIAIAGAVGGLLAGLTGPAAVMMARHAHRMKPERLFASGGRA